METLQDVMTASVITIAPDRPVSHALGIMEQRKISALVVAEKKKPLGILTERALIQIRAGGEIDYSQPIQQVMSSPPFTASVDMDYREAYQLLLHHRIRHLVVTDHDGNLVGIVTVTDFLSHLGLEYFMEFKNVGQVMIRDVVTLKSTSSAFTAMKLMNDRRISSLVIEENGSPKGIVTERDLLRLIHLKIKLEDIRLQEVMSQPVQTVFSDVSSHTAAKILLKKSLRRLVVINSSGRSVGIITETDLIKGLRTSYTDHLKDVIQQQARQLEDVTERKKAVQELEKKKKEAEEANIALKVMLDQHTRAKESIEKKIAIKLKELVIPYLDILRQSTINEKQAETINIIAAHIDSITHSFSPKAREIALALSPRETMIADLVWQGKTSKDIAEILNISLRTVETYRNNLRKKLGINKKKISLRTYLMNHFTQ
ncbi:MAG: CBS domain-containing protein [Desulfovibrionaceae bacterium]|jgi:CBS domain-containing protein/DNA-binding CsgD family transcriptional regulator|nr:CBS domain-containing protein [Desulfovibrionaceae bacterium]